MTRQRHDEQLARWAREGKEGTKPVAAATVILLRDSADGLETLMLRRNSKIAFGGMWVFPGGRVDPEDCAGLPEEDDLAAARVAAVREAHEEAGLRLGDQALVPFSHWTPPAITPRRFLTWFFAAEAPSDEVRIDDGEIREHAWMSPRQAMSRRNEGDIELAPPTWVTLHELALFDDVGSALSAVAARTPERFETRIAVTDDGPVALWHGDAGYQDGDPHCGGARHRLLMHGSLWDYVRSDPGGSGHAS